MFGTDLFDALVDVRRWLTPEVVMATVAAVAAIATIVLMVRDTSRRKRETEPRISLRVRSNSFDGLFACTLSIRNRLDSQIVFSSAWTRWPLQFTLAKSGLHGQHVLVETASRQLLLDWAVDPGHTVQRVLYIKPEGVALLFGANRAAKVFFKLTAHETTRRDIVVPAKTNTINWRPQVN